MVHGAYAYDCIAAKVRSRRWPKSSILVNFLIGGIGPTTLSEKWYGDGRTGCTVCDAPETIGCI